MLSHILKANNGEIPENCIVAFANTGKEREETLKFVKDCEEHWGIKITWLEYDFRPEAAGGIKDRRHSWKEVTFETASRNGEPFATLIDSKLMLPNAVMRLCTQELKINPINRWVYDTHGWRKKDIKQVLGIRYDERRRWEKALMTECKSVYPMVYSKVIREDVDKFWREQNFDLGIHSDLGNCDLCFLKDKDKIRKAIELEPSRANWWMKMEENLVNNPRWNPDLAKSTPSFSKYGTYRELYFKNKANKIVDDKEIGVDCFCGD